MINANEITNKKFVVFMTVAFGAAYIPLCIAGIAYGAGNTFLSTFLFRFVAVFIPLIAVLAARLPFKKLGWKPKFKFKYLIGAWVGPQLISWLGTALFFAFNQDTFEINTDSFASLLPAELSGTVDFSSIDPKAYFIVMAVMSLTALPFSQILPSLGEEAGWRGIMYPFLKSKLGPVFGKLVGGALWGIWHWPLIILGGYFYEGDYFGKPVLGPVMICISLCAFGVLIDCFYEKTNCIWIPAIMHSSMNASAVPLQLLLKSGNQDLSILGPGYMGLLGCSFVIVAAIILLILSARKDCEAKKA